MWESLLLVLLFFAVAGDPPPAINEAHYLVKAKNFWQPEWLANDLFASSGKAHATFYWVFGWLTAVMSLDAAAWVGRFVGWTLLAVGLQRLTWTIFRQPYASLAVAVFWIVGIARGNLAGEWVVGGVEAKLPAYGLVLLALERIVAGHWRSVWLLLGGASAFHVLVGGWSVVAAALPRLLARGETAGGANNPKPAAAGKRNFRDLPFLFLGGLVALFGLVPALRLAADVTPQETNIASHIYVYGRLRHHLLPSSFPLEWFVRYGVLLALTVAAGWLFWRGATEERWRRSRPLFLFAAGTVVIAVCGMLLSILPAVAPGPAARLLRFYWFRMSDAIVPLACGVALVGCLLSPPRRIAPQWIRGLVILLLTACVASLGTQFVESLRRDIPPAVDSSQLTLGAPITLEEQQRVYQDWRAVCRWAREQTPEGTVFVTPRHQQTFKWYAARPEVVNWKDVPQDVASLLEWARRFNRVFPQVLGRAMPDLDPESLSSFRRDYDARYIIIDRRIAPPPASLRRVYPANPGENETYAIYALP